MYLESALFLSILAAIISILISCHIVRRVKNQVAEMVDILTDIKNGNGNRRILSEAHEIVAPLAYEIKFQNDMTSFKSKDDILTLLIHLGYLTYEEPSQMVSIPNEEIRSEFVNAIEDAGWEYSQSGKNTSVISPS